MNKFAVCFLAIIGAAMAEHYQHEQMEATKKQCQTQVGASDADAASLKPYSVPQTRGASCILACMQKQSGIMNADNTFNSAKALAQMSHMQQSHPEMYSKMVTVINACKAAETAQSDQCTAAQTLAQCMQTQITAQGIQHMQHH